MKFKSMRQLITYLMLVASFSVSLAQTADSLYYEIVYSGAQDEILYKHDFIYDDYNNLILQRYFSWNETDAKYTSPQSITEFEREYDSNGNQTLVAQYNFRPPLYSRYGVYKKEFTYDQNDHLTSSTASNWNYSTQQWVELSLIEDNYTEEVLTRFGKPDTLTNYHWDSSAQEWVPVTRDIYQYLSDSTQMVHINYTYSDGSWVPLSKEEASDYKYDGMEIILCYNWENDSWVESHLLMKNSTNEDDIYVADPDGDTEVWIKYNDPYKYVLKFNSSHYLIDEEHYKLVGTDYIGTSKFTYEYNAENKTTLAIQYKLNTENQTWEDSLKWETSYSNGKKDTTFLQKNYGSGMQNYLLFTYQYNEDGQETHCISNYWHSNNNTTPYHKDSCNYDSQGSLIYDGNYTYSSTTGNWQGTSRTIWQYDYSSGTKHKLKQINEEWDEDLGIWHGTPDQFSYYIWQYDTLGRLINYKDLAWSAKILDYSSYEETLWEYHDNGQIKQKTKTWYEPENNIILEEEKLLQDFDSDDNLIYKEEYGWSTTLNKLIGETKLIAEYTNNRLTLSEEYNWDSTADNWIGYQKYTNSFDEKDRIKVVTNYSWNNTDWVKEDSRTYYYERPEYTVTFNIGTQGSTTDQTIFTGLHYGDTMPTAPGVIPGEGMLFTGWDTIPMPQTVSYDIIINAEYSEAVSTAINLVESTSVRIFPNPATDYITIISPETIDSVIISDLQGNTVYKDKVTNSIIKINISHLPSGIYVINTGSIKNKIVKQ